MISTRPVGDLLREWRQHRRLSQLELAGNAEIATRHLSFLENGRAQPGTDRSNLENGRLNLYRDRPHQLATAARAFFGADKNSGSPEIMDWWVRMMVDQCSLKVMLNLHRVFTETDFRPALRAITVPTLLIHGDNDTSTPLELTSRKAARLIPGCRLIVYENAAHGLPVTHKDRLNADLLAFVKG